MRAIIDVKKAFLDQVEPPPAGGAEDAGLVGVCTESTSFYAEAGGQAACLGFGLGLGLGLGLGSTSFYAEAGGQVMLPSYGPCSVVITPSFSGGQVMLSSYRAYVP